MARSPCSTSRCRQPRRPRARWRAGHAGFEVVLRHAPIEPAGRALLVAITRTGPTPHEAAVRLGIRLDPAPDPWLLVPGVLYGENRPAGSTLPYPAWRLDPVPDDPWASDRWVVRADRAATPMALASDGIETIAIATRETGELGIHGLEVAATRDATEVAVWAPYQERPVRYDGSPQPRPPVVQRHRWAPGETRTIEARAFVAPPGRQAFAPILRALDAWLAAGPGDHGRARGSGPGRDRVGEPRRRRRAGRGGAPALALATRRRRAARDRRLRARAWRSASG